MVINYKLNLESNKVVKTTFKLQQCLKPLHSNSYLIYIKLSHNH